MFLLRLAAPFAIAGVVFLLGHSAGSANTQRKWDLATAAQVKAQLAATEAARATEQAYQLKITEANDARELDRKKNARIAAGLRADNDRLRDAIAGFARGGPSDTAAAAGERAAALGGLLDEALRASGACSGDAESLANDLRAMLRAWPVSQ